MEENNVSLKMENYLLLHDKLESDLKEIKICSSHFESVFGTLSCQRKQEWLELGTLLFLRSRNVDR